MNSTSSHSSGLYRAARAIYQTRRSRENAAEVHRGLFGEPAWDILLYLYIALNESRPVYVSAVCDDTDLPATTMLRWLARLEEQGFISRRMDGEDARRRQVDLTGQGRDFIERLLAQRQTVP